jgi:hypothetical protein
MIRDTQNLLAELKAEHDSLSKRYDKDMARAARFSERSVDEYMDSAEAKRILNRIVEIDLQLWELSR